MFDVDIVLVLKLKCVVLVDKLVKVVVKIVCLVDKLVKFGFYCDVDFVLYLLMCYEDEIMLLIIVEVMVCVNIGWVVQVEGIVMCNEVVFWLC